MSNATLFPGSLDARPTCGSRDVETRRRLLDESRVHVLPLEFFVHSIRGEREYRTHGQGGAILMRTPELRVVVEAMEAGERLASQPMRGPATLYVLEGELELVTPADSFRVRAREVVVLPRAEERAIQAVRASSFLLAVVPETRMPDPLVHAREGGPRSGRRETGRGACARTSGPRDGRGPGSPTNHTHPTYPTPVGFPLVPRP